MSNLPRYMSSGPEGENLLFEARKKRFYPLALSLLGVILTATPLVRWSHLYAEGFRQGDAGVGSPDEAGMSGALFLPIALGFFISSLFFIGKDRPTKATWAASIITGAATLILSGLIVLLYSVILYAGWVKLP